MLTISMAVATAVLQATVEIPSRYGLDLLPYLERWGKNIIDRVRDSLNPVLPAREAGEEVIAYTWSRTVACHELAGSSTGY